MEMTPVREMITTKRRRRVKIQEFVNIFSPKPEDNCPEVRQIVTTSNNTNVFEPSINILPQ